MIRFHDTLSGEKKPLSLKVEGEAGVYVCGPTVYDYAHLGHARCYVVYDVLIRHLRESGLNVKYVRNITDIDDKILKRSAENGEEPTALAERFTAAFQEDMRILGCADPDVEPKVSEHLEGIFEMVQTLIDKGHAYESDGDVYFSVESCKDYGKLSHRDLEQMLSGASGRLDENQTSRKKNAADFALWKKGKEGVEGWDSPWGRGRPGWHIECSVMSTAHLGPTLDLHGGGLDLVFPHHENEIAQAECATGQPFCDHWVHNGFVQVDGEKMAKSVGNFFTARELFHRVLPEAIRFFMMTVHYRSPLNLDWTLDDEGNVTGFPQIEEAEKRVEYLYQTRRRLNAVPEKRIIDSGIAPRELTGLEKGISEAFDDDLNMPIAVARVSEFLKAVNEACDAAMKKKGKLPKASYEAALAGFATIETRLGLGTADPETTLNTVRDRRAAARGLTPADVEAQIEARANARAEKNFEQADEIRKALSEKGIELHDGPEGTTWSAV